MFYPKSEVLLNKYSEYEEYIVNIDSYLYSLDPQERSQMNIDVIADVTGIPIGVVEFLFKKYCEEGLMKEENILFCPIEESPIKEIENNHDSIFEDFCDICAENHKFTNKDIKTRYSIIEFPKGKTTVQQSDIGLTSHEHLDSEDIEKISNQMRLLNLYCNELESKPFEGKRFIIVLHFLKDLIPFMCCCEKLGLNPKETILFYKEYLYPHKEPIIEFFKEKGYIVSSILFLDDILKSFQDQCENNEKPIIIIEDGGYIVPKVHENEFSLLNKQTLGAVEQTTKGQRRDEEVEKLNFPVINVAGSILKNTYEPPHIARTVVRNIQNLLVDTNFSSQKALVIGYGSIGKSIVESLKSTLKMIVTVHDKDPDKLVHATNETDVQVEPYSKGAVKNKFLIIGATGEASIGLDELTSMEHNVYLISASSDQVEIGLKNLESLKIAKKPIDNKKEIGTEYTLRGTKKIINLVADGYPINFWANESMPNEASDLIMTLIFLSTIEIANNHQSMPKKINSEIVNEIAKANKVSERYLSIYNLIG